MRQHNIHGYIHGYIHRYPYPRQAWTSLTKFQYLSVIVVYSFSNNNYTKTENWRCSVRYVLQITSCCDRPIFTDVFCLRSI